jgi:hypothetical protein
MSTFPQSYFYIKNRQSGFVLDVYDGGMTVSNCWFSNDANIDLLLTYCTHVIE